MIIEAVIVADFVECLLRFVEIVYFALAIAVAEVLAWN